MIVSPTTSFKVITFYKFIDLPDYISLQKKYLDYCHHIGLKGTILLAKEGINATLAGYPEQIDVFLAFLQEDPRLQDIIFKISYSAKQPFYRMKVRLKKEIVTLGQTNIRPQQKTGTYIKGEDWNKLILDENTILIDTRNDYEYALGTFKQAVNPKTKSFREFPEFVKKELSAYKHKNIAMFCTGGIRCEKAAAYMLNEGFEHVYQLEGGILNYLETTPKAQSLWEGECFVFDERVAVNHDIAPGQFELCRGCRHPLSPQDKTSPFFEEGVTCPACYHQLTEAKKQGCRQRHQQILAHEKFGTIHK